MLWLKVTVPTPIGQPFWGEGGGAGFVEEPTAPKGGDATASGKDAGLSA